MIVNSHMFPTLCISLYDFFSLLIESLLLALQNIETMLPSESDRLAGDHLFGKLLFTWLSLVVSMVMSFCAVLFPTRCLG